MEKLFNVVLAQLTRMKTLRSEVWYHCWDNNVCFHKSQLVEEFFSSVFKVGCTCCEWNLLRSRFKRFNRHSLKDILSGNTQYEWEKMHLLISFNISLHPPPPPPPPPLPLWAVGFHFLVSQVSLQVSCPRTQSLISECDWDFHPGFCLVLSCGGRGMLWFVFPPVCADNVWSERPLTV